jgi:phosphatidylglycerol---prolipoprotein diacylglyceryl transferase
MIELDNTGIKLFALTIYWSSIFVVLGVWIAAEVAARLALRKGYAPMHVWRGLLWVIVLSLIFGRLWFVLFPPMSYINNGLNAQWLLSHFFDLNQGGIAIWAGGLGFFGALIGGILGLYLYTRRNHLPFLAWLDLAALVLPLAQAIARIGNGIRQDLYGAATDLPWGMWINQEEQRVAPYTDLNRYPLATTRFYPTFFYEILLLIGILIILWGAHRKLRTGDTALLYILLYGVGRFLLEFLRANVSLVGSINVSQVAAAVVAIAAAFMLWQRKETVHND